MSRDEVGSYYLLHANVARARAPLDSPVMLGFTSLVDEIDAIAHRSPGFITEPSLPDDGAIYQPPLLLNISTWSSIESLDQFVHSGQHAAALGEREQWFIQDQRANYVLFWIPKGYSTTEREIEARLDFLRARGPSAYAFTFDCPFPSPEAHHDGEQLG